jgi:ATP-dependent Clp protease, protease subunit
MTWYHIARFGNTAVVSLGDDIGAWGITAEAFERELGDASAVELRIDSAGGDAATALTLYELLKEREVSAIVTRQCCSAAILVLLAAQHRTAYPDAALMIHPPMRHIVGLAGQLREAANDLEQLQARMGEIMRERTGQRSRVIEYWLAGPDRWLDASEAREFGLIDGIISEPALSPKMAAALAGEVGGRTEDEQLCLDLLNAIGPVRVKNRDAFGRRLGEWFLLKTEEQKL